MGLIQRIAERFTVTEEPAKITVTDTRDVDFDMYAFAPFKQSFGVTDNETPDYRKQRQAYRSLLWRLFNMRSNALGNAIRNFEVKREVNDGEFEPVEADHPWKRLLASPSESIPTQMYWQWVALARDISKGAFLFVRADARGVPAELMPVWPEHGQVNAWPDASGGVGGYVYYRNDGQVFPVERQDVVWLRHMHPTTPVESVSLLEAAAFQSDSDLYMNVYQRDHLRDARTPPYALATDQEIQNEDTLKQAERRFEQKMKGHSRNPGRPLILANGMKAEVLGISPKDLLYADIAELNESDLHKICGVPEGLFSKDANRANAETHERTFIEHTIQPEAELIADQLSHSFRMAFGAVDSTLTITCPDLTPVRPEERERIRKMQFETGQRTINDFLREDGFEEVDGGERRYRSISLQPIDDDSGGTDPL